MIGNLFRPPGGPSDVIALRTPNGYYETGQDWFEMAVRFWTGRPTDTLRTECTFAADHRRSLGGPCWFGARNADGGADLSALSRLELLFVAADIHWFDDDGLLAEMVAGTDNYDRALMACLGLTD